MKKWFLVLIFILGLMLTGNYKFSNFDLTSSSSLSKKTISLCENYYLGYGLRWNSLIKPTLVNIELRDTNGIVLNKNHDQIEITPFIDMQQHTGVLNESNFLEDSKEGYIDYVEINEVRIKEFNTLVLRVNLKDDRYINTDSIMTLRYRILGIPKQQSIELNGFFVNNNF